jgi:hypothetical protein
VLKVLAGVILISLVLTCVPSISLHSNGEPVIIDNLFENNIPAVPEDSINAYTAVSPILFTPNLGQLDPANVLFYVRAGGFWVTDDGIWFSLEWRGENGEGSYNENQLRNFAVKQTFVGANPLVPEGRVNAVQKYNFYYGNNPLRWQAGVTNFKELYFENIYDRIDLRYYSNENELKYDLIVNPGGDPSEIRIMYEGATGLEITKTGDMLVHTPGGDMIDRELDIYQELPGGRSAVDGKFAILDQYEYGIELSSEYDPAEKLVIDPYIEYSSFLGGEYRDRGEGIDIDDSLNAYVTGYTNSEWFPTTTGAYDIYLSGNYDAFVTKFNGNGSEPVYSTYLGAISDDRAYDIKVNNADEAFITGSTASNTFPTTSLVPHKGLTEAFVVKLDNSGKMLYSALVGGSANDYGRSIAVNFDGYAFVAGDTKSDDFPASAGALNESHNGNSDIIVFKLNPAGAQLEFATYIGGTFDDFGYGIAVDQYDYPYVVGASESDNFPTTSGVYKEEYNNNRDAVIFKLNLGGTALQYSTYYGGWFDDGGNDIAVDADLEAYVTGSWEDTDSDGINGFAIKLDAFGQSLKYEFRIEGEKKDICNGIALDQNENAYVTGVTESSELQTITDPGKTINHFNQGNKDVFVYKLNSDGNEVGFFTFIGGARSDEGADITVDSGKNIYLTGYTSSSDFPATDNAFDTGNNLNDDAFVMKISFWEKLEIDSFTLLKDNNPTSLVYAQHGVYNFELVITNTYSPRDIRQIDVSLDPSGTSEVLKCEQGAFDPQQKFDVPEYFGFSNYLYYSEFQPNSSVLYNGFEVLTFNFYIVFNWNYPDEDMNNVRIDITSDNFGSSTFSFLNVYQVENDLKLSGDLEVIDENNNTLNDYDYARGGSWILWTGITAVYEGTTDVYPSPAKTPTLTIADSFDYTIDITNVPPENVAFGQTFSIRIDNDTVRFFNPIPVDNVKSNNVEVGITVYDEHSRVEAKSIQYSYSLDGGTAWTDWEPAEGYDDAAEIHVRVSLVLGEGAGNRIKWQALDTLGNGPGGSHVYNVSVNQSFASEFGVRLRLSVKSLNLDPGSFFTINVTVENTGKFEDDIVITPFSSSESVLNAIVLGNNTVRLKPSETAVVLIYISSLGEAAGEHVVNVTGTSTGSYVYGLTIGDYRHLSVIFNTTDDQKPPDGEKPEDEPAMQFNAGDLNFGYILAIIIIAIIVIIGYIIFLRQNRDTVEEAPSFDKVAVFIKPKEEELDDFMNNKDEKRKRGKEEESKRDKVIDMQQSADGSFTEQEKY